MESGVIHISQGNVLRLLDGEKEFLLKAFEPRGINTGCIDFQQNIVSFPQACVGYINPPARRIMIGPKHNGVDLRHIIKIYYFLCSSDSPDLDEPMYNVDSGSTFDIVELFISELDKVAKKGLPIEYREGKENLQYLRGDISVVQTMIGKQLGRRDILDYSFDELSRDITINQVLYKAYNKAVRITDMGETSLLSRDFGDISDIYQIPQITLNTNTMYCKKALTLAYMILSNLSVSDHGDQAYGQNFLVNFDRFFEDLIGKILVTYSGSYDFTYWESEKQYAARSSADYDDYFKSCIPGMLYSHQENEMPISAFGILDMKNRTSKPFSNADIYQMFSCANESHSKYVILCCLVDREQQNAVLKFNNEDFSLKQIHGVCMDIADDTSKEFKESMSMSINKIKALA